jgi:hypothetical protein
MLKHPVTLHLAVNVTYTSSHATLSLNLKTFFSKVVNFFIIIYFLGFQPHCMFQPIWPTSNVKTVVGWKLLCFV